MWDYIFEKNILTALGETNIQTLAELFRFYKWLYT